MTILSYAKQYLDVINIDGLQFTEQELRKAIKNTTDQESIKRLVRDMYVAKKFSNPVVAEQYAAEQRQKYIDQLNYVKSLDIIPPVENKYFIASLHKNNSTEETSVKKTRKHVAKAQLSSVQQVQQMQQAKRQEQQAKRLYEKQMEEARKRNTWIYKGKDIITDPETNKQLTVEELCRNYGIAPATFDRQLREGKNIFAALIMPQYELSVIAHELNATCVRYDSNKQYTVVKNGYTFNIDAIELAKIKRAKGLE